LKAPDTRHPRPIHPSAVEERIDSVPRTKPQRLSNQLPKRKSTTVAPRQVARVGRNEPCPCGSGKKYKDCHEREGDAYLRKIAYEQRRRETQAKLKADGVPWYRRLFMGG
jgi:hypothetical protein